jgi:hypothetical protein
MALWPALEAAPGPTGVLRWWQSATGDEFPLLEPYLQPRGAFALSIPCPRPRRPHLRYRVVELAPDGYVGVCDETDERIALARDDLLVYEIDWPLLREDLARAFGFDPAPAEPDDLPAGVQLIGSHRPTARFAFPAYLVVALESRSLMHAVCALASTCQTPFLLLAPTRRHVRLDALRVLESRRCAFLPLQESLTADAPRSWRRTPAGDATLEAFTRQHVPAAEPVTAGTFFPTPAGARWSELRLHFLDGHTLRATIGSVTQVLTYGDMGMSDRRNSRPTAQWELLRTFAKEGGMLTWDSPAACRQNQKRRERLTRDLRAFFRIDGEPIALTEDGRGWRTVFRIDPES